MYVPSTVRALSLIPMLVLGACSGTEPSAALLPVGAQQIAAPAVYAEWYGRTESCSGAAGDFSKVKFFVVPNARSFQSEFGETVALWRKVGAEQYIIVSGEYQQHEMVLRHEMLHALLVREGHPAEYFVARCRLTWETWGTATLAAGGPAPTSHSY